MQKKPIVLTLASIPPRFANLPRKFQSLEKQTQRPDFVELNIPQNYRRFPGELPTLPTLPDWVSIKFCEIDYGPASKVLPTVERWRNKEADFLICDDDRVHDCAWIERLAKTRQERPDDIITERGWNINERFGNIRADLDIPRALHNPRGGRTLSYRFKRAISLGMVHPPRKLFDNSGYIDIFEGFLGVLMPSTALPELAHSIPEIIWTVDDVWLSGMAYYNGVKVWAHDIPRPVYSDGYYDKLASLRNFTHANYNRESADRHAVEYLRSVYHVWR